MHNLIIILLAPLLLLQGRYVRQNTPRLPEAAGDRGGSLGEGRPLRVLLVGDSAAAGVGVDTQSQALSGCLTRELARDYRVHWQLIAKSGNTTADLIRTLEELEPGEFDVVLISLGVNDVLSPLRVSRWIEQQGGLIKLLRRQFSVRHILLTHVPPMEQFPALPQPLRWCLGQRAKAFNTRLTELSRADKNCELVNIEQTLDRRDMAVDGFHPGSKIYRVWGESAADLIARRLG
ncbi:SGNH/GDSL hydrolase family protein [Shewanella atlantica]|uniref:SGNH/GDSL hydrolase family protein n=1 Tax=Shewanella atlantica TaxID=271099 RepID=UPI003735A4A6